MDAPARVRAAERQTRCIASGRTGCPEGAGWSVFFPPEAECFLRGAVVAMPFDADVSDHVADWQGAGLQSPLMQVRFLPWSLKKIAD